MPKTKMSTKNTHNSIKVESESDSDDDSNLGDIKLLKCTDKSCGKSFEPYMTLKNTASTRCKSCSKQTRDRGKKRTKYKFTIIDDVYAQCRCGSKFEQYINETNGKQARSCLKCLAKSRNRKRYDRVDNRVRGHKFRPIDDVYGQCRCGDKFELYVNDVTGKQSKSCLKCLDKDQARKRKKYVVNRNPEKRKAWKEMRKAENPRYAAEWSAKSKAKIRAEMGDEQWLDKEATQARKWRKNNPDKEGVIQDRRKLNPENRLWSLKYQAIKKGNDWIIEDDVALKMVIDDCYFCGVSITDTCHGIDRMDNTRGYIDGNVVTACKMCNYIKCDYPLKLLLNKIRNILVYRNIVKDNCYPGANLNSVCVSYKRYNMRANDKKLLFELTMSDYTRLTSRTSICYMCGKKGSSRHRNGIDRVDNALGYSNSNCESCCGMCNKMKKDYDLAKFIDKLNAMHVNRCKMIKEFSNEPKKIDQGNANSESINNLLQQMSNRKANYELEISANSRASCIVCNKKIMIGTNRIHVPIYLNASKKTYQWCHDTCVRRYDIGNKKVKKKVRNPEYDNMPVELAPSSRSTCAKCHKKIAKGDPRVQLKCQVWVHYNCATSDIAREITIAPSNRGKCLKCKQKINKGDRRYKYNYGWCHEECEMGVIVKLHKNITKSTTGSSKTGKKKIALSEEKLVSTSSSIIELSDESDSSDDKNEFIAPDISCQACNNKIVISEPCFYRDDGWRHLHCDHEFIMIAV